MAQLALFDLPASCSVEECSRSILARGMCVRHYNKWRRTERNEPCSIEGCQSPAVARRWCNSHYLRWTNHGDPLGGKPSPRVARAQDNEDGTRICLDCEVTKPIDQFPRDANASRGRRSNCKLCHTARAKAWYAENKAEHLPRQKARYQRDIDKHRARDMQRHERDKPKRIALATEAVHRRRALMQQVEYEPGITVKALRKKHGDDCCYCGMTMMFAPGNGRTYVPLKATIEHIVAISKGGGHTWANTTLACWQCNVRKNAKPLDQWLESVAIGDEVA